MGGADNLRKELGLIYENCLTENEKREIDAIVTGTVAARCRTRA